MAQQTDIGGGASFCSISPSDNVGIIENFLRRIEELEKTVSQLAAANTLANRLSDLSQQVGWVTGIEYLGTPGWSQTEYGTLVPPANGWSFFGNDGQGWLLSDGNYYNGGVWDSDGNLILGATTDGRILGTQAGGAASWLIVEPASATLSTSGLNATADLTTILYSGGTAFGTSQLDESTIDILENGLYRISVNMLTGVRSSGGATWMEVLVRDGDDNPVKSVHDSYGQHGSPNSTNQTLRISFTFEALANYDVRIMWNNTSGALLSNIASSVASIEQIKKF